jgi:hypothetical protein
VTPVSKAQEFIEDSNYFGDVGRGYGAVPGLLPGFWPANSLNPRLFRFWPTAQPPVSASRASEAGGTPLPMLSQVRQWASLSES